MSNAFLSPRLVGERFEEHAIPLEMLKDLAVLEEMIVEVAKWHYINEHQGRQRVPRGFTDGVSLKLLGIDEGSAIPLIALAVTPPNLTLFPPENQVFFEKARDSIVAAIAAAESDASITEHLPERFLGYFDRMGRSLREDEVIEFSPQSPQHPARLNRTNRRRLLLASSQVQEVTEEVTLRGLVPEADQDKNTFTLQLFDGLRISAPITPQHRREVLDAFNGYPQHNRIRVRGVGRYNRQGRLQSIESVEHISPLDANDVAVRLDEFRTLKHGWLDGKGFAPSPDGLNWLTSRFERHFPDDLPNPYLYPTPAGGVQAEWSLSGHEISLEIDLITRAGLWHDLDMQTEDDTARSLSLDSQADWTWLVEQLRPLAEPLND